MNMNYDWTSAQQSSTKIRPSSPDTKASKQPSRKTKNKTIKWTASDSSALRQFLNVILKIETGERRPQNKSERRIDALVNQQITPETKIEKLYRRWHVAGRPHIALPVLPSPLLQTDWDRFEHNSNAEAAKARRTGAAVPA